MICASCAIFSFGSESETPPHFSDGRFHNNYPHDTNQSFWLWKWEELREGVPKPPPGGWKIPHMKADAAALRANTTQPTVTWIGHATFLVQLAGLNILTDPQFSERASPVQFAGPKRIVPLPISIDELPRIDVVLVSHNHYDHLDVDTVKRLAAREGGGPRFLVPLGLKAWFAGLGIERVSEYDWWQAHTEGTVRFTLVPVQHWSKRTLWDTNKTLWGGWAMEGGGLKLLHAGDMGYSKDARDIGERLGPFDLAMIPIGAYAPRWFMKTHHLDPVEALQVRSDVHASRAIGMHWGTFENLTDEPLDEPPQVLARQRAAAGLPTDAFDVMKVGETRKIEKGAH
ncbi:MAG TPA: MBL fold metallo-hydrolase [Usitatibacter sp.]|jgi:L-ascorbate metabolism protein UlaG (beta-lactamase superfamily)|nr:MBL fold metallo-hydrolase [Usitatibacter sp.]